MLSQFYEIPPPLSSLGVLTPEAIAARYNLRKSGDQWQGPCFLCGGKDRLWTKYGRNGQTLIHCRQCDAAPFRSLFQANTARKTLSPAITRDYLATILSFMWAYEGAMSRGEQIATLADHQKYGKYARVMRRRDAKRLARQWGLIDG